MAALSATATGSSEGPPTTGTFCAIFNNTRTRGEINHAYNRELAQRGLTHLQIPGGEDLQQLGMDQTTAIARPDLYMRAYECVHSRLRIEAAPISLSLTTKSYFYVLHDLNCAHGDNLRGKVNARYNQLILRNNEMLCSNRIPGGDLEELGMDGYQKCSTILRTWYIKAFGDVVGEKDRFSRCPGLSAEESIMDRFGTDPIRAILSHLSMRDLAVSKGVCRAWAHEVRGLQKSDASCPISGPIEAQFPFHQVFGPQFWAQLQTQPSQHPDSAGHPQETVGEFLMRRREALLTQAAALAEENPAEAKRLTRIAEGYMLDCQATWTRAQVVSLYQMMGSVAGQVEDGRGCGIVLKPKEYHLDIHRDIVTATAWYKCYTRGGDAVGFQHIPQLDELSHALPSGPVTLSAISNTLLAGSRNTRIDEQDARVRALGCGAPELLDLLIHIHFTCSTKHIDLYSMRLSSVQESTTDGRRYEVGRFSYKRGLLVRSLMDNACTNNTFGVGVQRKVTAEEQAKK